MEISLDYVVNFLNQLVEYDQSAVLSLINSRVECNEELADHPTVQVGEDNNHFTVGFLGVINGLFPLYNDDNVKNFGQITAIIGDNSLEFIKTSDFQNSRFKQ